MAEKKGILAIKASIIDFFQGVMLELKKVDWPSKDQTIRLTGIVIIVSLLIGIGIGGLDIAFTKLIQLLIATKK